MENVCHPLGLPAAVILTSGVQAQTRAALVIGNKSYAHLSQLANAVNDSIAIAAELRKSSFEVTELRDARADDTLSKLVISGRHRASTS